jgi:AcrR family transcriptional regulator
MSPVTEPARGRANQKARTRAALVEAAAALVREGEPPSVPAAAALARISPATAYRYFSSADDLWFEASDVAVDWERELDETDARVEAHGDDVRARLDEVVRSVGWRMLDDQVPFRRIARQALEQSLTQADGPDEEPVPVRAGRRNRSNRKAVEPLRGRLSEADLDRLVAALGLVVGTEAMIALSDGVGLDPEAAKTVQLDAARWLLAGALAELDPA